MIDYAIHTHTLILPFMYQRHIIHEPLFSSLLLILGRFWSNHPETSRQTRKGETHTQSCFRALVKKLPYLSYDPRLSPGTFEPEALYVHICTLSWCAVTPALPKVLWGWKGRHVPKKMLRRYISYHLRLSRAIIPYLDNLVTNQAIT